MIFILQLLDLIISKIKFKYNLLTLDNYNDEIFNFIQKQGFVFIKLCQIITSQNHLKKKLGNELFLKLTLLQDKCYQSNYINYPDIVYLQKEPIASGSICQIFEIFYKNKNCALKQLIPNINSSFNESFKNLKLIKNILYYFYYEYYQLINYIDLNEYNNYIIQQTNLDLEVNNINIFYKIFDNNSNIIIPKVYYYDSYRIIMGLEKGLKYDDFIELHPEFKEEAIFLFCSFVYKSIMNNIIHGDLHNGNFSYKIYNNKLHLIVYDFGIVYPISNVEKEFLISLIENQNNSFQLIIEYLKNDYDIIIKNDCKSYDDIIDGIKINKNLPIKILSILSCVSFFTKKKYKGSIISFNIKLMNYIYKNNFYESS